MIDQYNHGKVNADNLREFIGKFAHLSDINGEDVDAWIRRYDQDVDGGLQFIDLVNALQTMTNFQPDVITKVNRQTNNSTRQVTIVEDKEGQNNGEPQMTFLGN